MNDLDVWAGWLRKRVLLEGATMTARPGEVTLVFGPSGAGKSTLIRAVLGISKDNAGVSILGRDAQGLQRSSPRRVAVVPQFDSLNPALTPRQALTYSARLWGRGTPKRSRPQAADAWAELTLGRVGIGPSVADTPTSRLSGGERKRVGLAVSLASSPDVLLLDEPTTGLDFPSEQRIFELFVDELCGRRKIAVVVVSHAAWMAPKVGSMVLLGPARTGPGAETKGPGTVVAQGRPGQVMSLFEVDDNPVRLLERAERSSPAMLDQFQRSPLGLAASTLARGDTGRRPTTTTTGAVSRPRQTLIFTLRALAVMWAQKRRTAFLLLAPLAVALLLLEVVGTDSFAGNGSYARTACYLGSVAVLSFGYSSSASTIVAEINAFWLECHGGLSLLAYALSRLLVSALLSLWIAGVFLLGFWVWQKPPHHGAWIPLGIPETACLLFASAMAASAFALLLSALAKDTAIAGLSVSVFLIAQLLLAGAFLPLDKSGGLLDAARLLPAYWSFDSLATEAGVHELDPGCAPPKMPDCRDDWRRDRRDVVDPLAALGAQSVACFGLLLGALQFRVRRGVGAV